MDGEGKTVLGELAIMAMPGCENLAEKVDYYLKDWRNNGGYLVPVSCPRFGTGEGKGLIGQSVRGHDIYIKIGRAHV